MSKDGELHPKFFQIRNCIQKCLGIDRGTATNLAMGLKEDELNTIWSDGSFNEEAIMDLMDAERVGKVMSPKSESKEERKKKKEERKKKKESEGTTETDGETGETESTETETESTETETDEDPEVEIEVETETEIETETEDPPVEVVDPKPPETESTEEKVNTDDV